jgi:hypothetical protein
MRPMTSMRLSPVGSPLVFLSISSANMEMLVSANEAPPSSARYARIRLFWAFCVFGLLNNGESKPNAHHTTQATPSTLADRS